MSDRYPPEPEKELFILDGDIVEDYRGKLRSLVEIMNDLLAMFLEEKKPLEDSTVTAAATTDLEMDLLDGGPEEAPTSEVENLSESESQADSEWSSLLARLDHACDCIICHNTPTTPTMPNEVFLNEALTENGDIVEDAHRENYFEDFSNEAQLKIALSSEEAVQESWNDVVPPVDEKLWATQLGIHLQERKNIQAKAEAEMQQIKAEILKANLPTPLFYPIQPFPRMLSLQQQDEEKKDSSVDAHIQD